MSENGRKVPPGNQVRRGPGGPVRGQVPPAFGGPPQAPPPEQPQMGEVPDLNDPAVQELFARRMLAQARQQSGPPAQRWQCVVCVNNMKLAFAAIDSELKALGIDPDSELYQARLVEASQQGRIPQVRMADLVISGNSVCVPCFQPMKQTSLIMGSAGMVGNGGLLQAGR